MTITTKTTNNELGDGKDGLELKSVTVVVNFQEVDNYFGGQVKLTKEDDGISLQSTTDEISEKAIVKAKDLIANSKNEEKIEVENG